MAAGLFARGRQIAAGSFYLAGQLVETAQPWRITPPSSRFEAALQGWGWLDDLAAFGDATARTEARRWLEGWIGQYGHGNGLGTGAGWHPDLAGRRLSRWLQHGLFLTAGAEPELTTRYFAALGTHAVWLARSHDRVPIGLPRIEAQTGWLMAGLLLRGLEGQAAPALAALTETAAALIAEDGGIPSRNPEELLAILTHLGWCRALLEQQPDAHMPPATLPPQLRAAMHRAARALRALRHADGGLARFHGGGAGAEGQLDRTLSMAAPGLRERPARAMGFTRLEGGRSSLIVDTAPPPAGAAATTAHAATLAFELTSGRRPVILSCGPGRDFGAEWWTASRSTSAHSTLSIDGISSSRFATRPGRPIADATARALRDGPGKVRLHRSDERDASTLLMSHDGWVADFGLTHSRSLELSADGRVLLGSDELAALHPQHEAQLERALAAGIAGTARSIGFALRFHLHPEADASVDMRGRAASIALPSGEVWVFRFDGPAQLALEASVWLEHGRRAPRPCRQIVLRARLTGTLARINWTLAKGQDTPLAIRDVGADDDQALPRDFFDTE